MKTFVLAILFILPLAALQAEEAQLKASQVQAIASLVTKEIYHGNDYIPSEAIYEKATGIWTCLTINGTAGDHGYLFSIRDRDAFYKVHRWEGKGDGKFKMHSSLKKRIEKIRKAK